MKVVEWLKNTGEVASAVEIGLRLGVNPKKVRATLRRHCEAGRVIRRKVSVYLYQFSKDCPGLLTERSSRVYEIVRNGDATVADIVEKIKETKEYVCLCLTRLKNKGLVHIARWEMLNGHYRAVYRVGEGVNALKEDAKILSIPASWERVLDVLKQEDLPKKSISEQAGVPYTSIKPTLDSMMRRSLIHITAYKFVSHSESRRLSAIYRFGAGDNASCPKQGSEEYKRAYNESYELKPNKRKKSAGRKRTKPKEPSRNVELGNLWDAALRQVVRSTA